MKKDIKHIIYILFAAMTSYFVASCTENDIFVGGGNEEMVVRFRPMFERNIQTRTIGDGTGIDQLVVAVFEDATDELGNQILKFQYDQTYTWNEANNNGVNLTLINDRKYSIVFWAQNSQNTAYSISEEGWIKADYTDYLNGGFTRMEELDAFCTTHTITLTGVPQEPKELILTRRLAQLNMADDTTEPIPGQHVAKITYKKIPTAYNPFTDKGVEGEVEETMTFSFTDFPDEALESKGKTYHYVTSNYLFLPITGTIDLDYELSDGGETIQTISFKNVELKGNQRTNITGTVVQEPEAIWNGEETKMPVVENGCYVITCNEELAWLAVNEATTTCIRFDADLNMGGNALGALRILEGTTIEGNGHTVKGLNLTTSLLRNTKNLTVTDLHINGATATNAASVSGTAILVSAVSGGLNVSGLTFTDCAAMGKKKVGMLVGELKGSAQLHKVIVRKGDKSDWGTSMLETTDGQGGGLIGYVGRTSETDRNEGLLVTFDSCVVNNTYIKATGASAGNGLGKFVGTLSGYDYKEVLKFRDNCTTDAGTTLVSNYTSPYQEGNEGAWLAGNDYTTYNEWVGDEAYCRGIINFNVNELGTDSMQFIPKWDGVRSNITPLVENNVKLIYSAYDVANLQGKGHSSVTFMQHADLGGKLFNPISYVTTLEGNNHTLYNLKVDMEHDLSYGAAFIKYTSGTTKHQNFNMVGADIKNVHKASLPIPAYGVEEDGGAGNAYAGSFVATVGGNYTINNVHVSSGKVYAVCKMGGLIGRVGGVMNMDNCSVDNYLLENYCPYVPNYYRIPPTTILGFTVHGLQWWYTNGECGGLIGFIQSTETNIRNCSVTNSRINCEGQPNKEVVANVWNTSDFNNNPEFTSGKNLAGKANTIIAGRHVNQFVGDVVSQRAEGGSNYNVTISDYTVSGNSYNGVAASSTNAYSHQYKTNTYCEVVGCAYYVGVDVNILGVKKHVYYCAGSLTFNKKGSAATTITETVDNGNDKSWTGGDFYDIEIPKWYIFYMVYPKSEYPSAP